MKKTHAVKEILKKHNITSWYQPIVNIETKMLIGWEAFSRGPSVGPVNDTPAMFDSAAEAGVLKPFDLMCMHNATLCFEQLQLENKLFINLSNEMLVASSRLKKQVGALIADNEIPPSRIVLEIDERNACNNIEELIEAVSFFHEQGFGIAIDNIGGKDGTSVNETLSSYRVEAAKEDETKTLWSELKPHYVKIDRRFIHNINGNTSKQKLVREVVAVARSLNAVVIAEGVETQNELDKLISLGVFNVQGYFIQKPELAPLPPRLENILPQNYELSVEQTFLACDLIVSKEKIDATASVSDVLNIFETKVFLNSIAIVSDNTVVGLVYRTPFLAKLSTRQRREVLLEKSITSEMDRNFLEVDSHVHMEQVSRLVTSRARLHSEHDFAITYDNKFLGIGTAIDLLRKITQMRIEPHNEMNLLTILPGNIPISDCVNELLDKNQPFTIALLDLNNFKAFNNHYDHTKGDQLLVVFANLLKKHICNNTNFAGHIGGDDFVVIMRQQEWEPTFTSLFNEFRHRVTSFYSESEQANGGMLLTDLQGTERFVDFVSICAGAMYITDEYYDNFQTILPELIKVKQQIKRDPSLCLAHQDDSSLKLFAFENDEFSEKMLSTSE